MIKFFISLITVLNFISCKKNETSDQIIYFGTDQFLEFEKKTSITKEKAWKLQKKYLLDKNMDSIGGTLYFILNKKYVFSEYANLKLNEATSQGIHVNSKTGEIESIEIGNKIKNLKSTGWRGD